MQNYFRAFAFQNYHFRDYRPYFKPVVCYLEGTWTTNTKTLSEPFESDRHHIDAANWFDLQEKIRFTSYTGGKHYLKRMPGSNFAFREFVPVKYAFEGQKVEPWETGHLPVGGTFCLSYAAFSICNHCAAVIDEHRISQLEKKLEGLNLLERKFGDLARQLMLTELAMGEKARTEYD
jgi:hypothetical protein